MELDAYEKLRNAKRGSESFSQVVRRARFDPEESTGASLIRELDAQYAAGQGASDETLDAWDRMEKEEHASRDISPSHWSED